MLKRQPRLPLRAITNSTIPKIQTLGFGPDQYDTKLQSVGIVPVGDDDVYQVARPGKKGRQHSSGATEMMSWAVEVVNDPATYMEALAVL